MMLRDLMWRTSGAVMIAAGYFATFASARASGLTLIIAPASFLLAAAGLLLFLGGKRVPLALRIERSRHRYLPTAIHARRRARRRGH